VGREKLFAFRVFSSLKLISASFIVYAMYTQLWRTSRTNFTTDIFWCIRLLLSACVIGYEGRGVKTANGKVQEEQEQTEAQPDGA
jgi:hypothetical protein